MGCGNSVIFEMIEFGRVFDALDKFCSVFYVDVVMSDFGMEDVG